MCLCNLKRGEHLLEYIAAPTTKKRVLSYTAGLSGRIPEPIKAAIETLSCTIFNIRGRRARLKYEGVAISHDQSTDRRAEHFNFVIKFYLKRELSPGHFVDETTHFHDHEHHTREVTLNIHFQKCVSATRGKGFIVASPSDFIDALLNGLRTLNAYIPANIVAIDDLSIDRLTTDGYSSTRPASTTGVPAHLVLPPPPSAASAHAFLHVPPPPPPPPSHGSGYG